MELAEYRRMAEVEDKHWWYQSTRSLLQQLVADEVPQHGRYLDLGCGTGATGAWLGDRGELVAADFEPLALSFHHEQHPSSRVVACDANRLPFDDASFDLVMCVTMLCHRSIDAPSRVVGEMSRVVKPGGLVLLWEPGIRRLRRAHDRETHTGRRFARRDLAAMLAENGLVAERLTGAYTFLIPPAAAKTVLERRESSSDLDRHPGGLGGALGALAAVERLLLRYADLPFGLSVIAVGRRPSNRETADGTVAVSAQPVG